MKKRARNILMAAVAALLAALLVSLAAFALSPPTSSRYVDSEYYFGEVMTDTTTEDGVHGGHVGWTSLNLLKDSLDPGSGLMVPWPDDLLFEDGTFIIEPDLIDGFEYYYLYLTDDLNADIVIRGLDDDERSINVEVNLCLNGHALIGTGNGPVITVGEDYSGSAYEFYLYDCGGETDVYGDYHNVHYYKYTDDGYPAAGDVTVAALDYAFLDENGNAIEEKDADGSVRGGIVTGGYSSDVDYGAGVHVGAGTYFCMFGGTIMGNVGVMGAGVQVDGGEFEMWGGSIERNRSYTKSGSYGGGGVCLTNKTNSKNIIETDSVFCMYGGEIRYNAAAKGGGGVYVDSNVASSNTSHGCEFYMFGGTIEGNSAGCGTTVGLGGGVYIQGVNSGGLKCFFGMYAGSVRNNTSDFLGGGIYAINSNVEVTVTGGEITGNVQTKYSSSSSNTNGGGLCFASGTTLTISGTPYIYGNWCEGKACNLGLGSNYYMTLDELTDGARIGVTKKNASDGTQITTNYVEGAEAYFHSDDRSMDVESYSEPDTGDQYLRLVSR